MCVTIVSQFTYVTCITAYHAVQIMYLFKDTVNAQFFFNEIVSYTNNALSTVHELHGGMFNGTDQH